MKKILITITLLFIISAHNVSAQNGVKISVTEQSLNELIDMATISQLLSYSVWERGDLFDLILNCDGGIEFEQQEFYHATLASTVTVDIKSNNRFSLSSTKKHTNGDDIFFEGTGNLKSPLAIINDHLMIVHVTVVGTINGYFNFENHKLKLVLDDVDLNVLGITEGGTTCSSSWAFPIGFLDSPWELDVNIGSSLIPDALKGYFTSNSPVITTTSNKATITYETIPFIATELDGSHSATAAYQVSLGGITIPSSASNAKVTAGHSIILKNLTIANGANFTATIKAHNFGTEVID